jgi:hypothetical protein
MNPSLKAVFTAMLSKRIIGGKHIPEETMVNSKTKWLQKEELKQFETEYRDALNAQLLLRIKKRTGKGSDWHISLNPRKLKDVYELIR